MTLTARAVATDETFTAPPMQPAEQAPSAERRVISTQLGDIEIDPKTIVRFESGLLGFSEASEFVLVDLENTKFEQFRILQCVSDPSLSFIVFPPSLENGLIEKADIDVAAKTLGFAMENLVVLLLVTVRRSEEGSTMSLNLRAPVMIDTALFEGAQFVLPGEKYPVRFSL